MTMTQRDRDLGTAYAMKPAHTRTELTSVARGTPMGELLRRYWHPVGLVSDATDTPKKVRALGRRARRRGVRLRLARRGFGGFHPRLHQLEARRDKLLIGLRGIESRPLLFRGDFEVARVDIEQGVSLFHRLIVRHVNRRDLPRDFRRYRHDVSFQKSIVGRLLGKNAD